MKTNNVFFVSAILLSMICIESCKKENKTVPVQFLLTDKPIAYDSVNVHIVGMQVQINHDAEA